MSLLAPPQPIDASREWPVRLSVDAYQQMVASGVLTPDDRVELIDGYILPKVSKNPLHVAVTDVLRDLLKDTFGPGFYVREQDPIVLPDSVPEPDLAVVRGAARDYAGVHPTAEQAVLVVEVTDTSSTRDRGSKLRAYARAGVSVHWIVDVHARSVEVLTRPDASSETFAGRSVYAGSDLIPVSEGRRSIAVAGFFPA